MKPKPFSELNHLTVPVAIYFPSVFIGDKREFHVRQSFRSTAIPIQAKAIKRVLISVGLGLSLP
jgi:hypothetical protein